MNNKNLISARNRKDDEYYTLLEDIEQECHKHKRHFKNKHIYLNCDDYRYSNFFKYFNDNFKRLKLKKLTATHISLDGTPSIRVDVDENGTTYTELQDGSFQSTICIEILKECDVVVTNPPFSLFMEYIGLLLDNKKKFLIMKKQDKVATF